MSFRRSRWLESSATASFVVVAGGFLLAVIGVVATATSGHFAQPGIALAFGSFIALGELIRVTLPNGRDSAPIATAGGLAYALVVHHHNQTVLYGTLQVVAVVSVAMVVGMAPHVVVRRAPSPVLQARRVLVIGAVASVFRGTGIDEWLARQPSGPVQAGVIVGFAVTALALDAVLAAAVRASIDSAPFLAALRNEVQAQLGIGAAIGSTGALIALAATVMGNWALPVFVVPLILAQFAFRRFASVHESSLQTIRALSRVTELGGYTETGHSRRVSTLAVSIGRELGMTDAELRDLEYAALMHDIGQLSLAEPIPGGATVVAAPTEQRRIASLGGDIIRQTGVLDQVAHIVDQQAEPYRRAHEISREEVPLASRIVKAVNAYDDLVGDTLEDSRRLEALERLRLGMAYEYDPVVVETLSRIVERSIRLGD